MADLPKVGDVFGGRYRVERLVGRGGMGAVFQATDTQLGRPVALKVVLPGLGEDAEFRLRFEREAAILARIRSQHIVQIHEYGEQDGALFLVTNYLPDGDLHNWLHEHGPLDRVRAVTLCAQLADALADAHAAGVLHRDVKPSNALLWQRDDGRLVAYLCDFGIATDGDAQVTRTGTMVGSPAYMPPERHLGRPATVEGDIYSLGCVLWATLTGAPPYSGTDYQLVNSHLHEAVRQLAVRDQFDVRLNEVLARMMAKDPVSRPHSAAELATELQALAAGPSGPMSVPTQPAATSSPTANPTQHRAPATVPVTGERTGPPSPRSGTPMVVAGIVSALILVAAVAVAGVYLAQRGKNSPDAGTGPGATTSSPGGPSPSTAAQPGATTSADAGGMTYQQCSVGASSDDGRLVVDGLVPMSGDQSAWAPASRAGIGLAISDVDAVIGATDQPLACYDVLDVSDDKHPTLAAAAVQQVLSHRPSVVVGTGSSAVTDDIADTLDPQDVTQISATGTAFDIAGRSPYLFRTISGGYAEADALAQLIEADGRQRVAFLKADENVSPYGTRMRDAVQDNLGSSGVQCVYGCTGTTQEFPSNATEFSAEITALQQSAPDAIVVMALHESVPLLSQLRQAGIDMSRVYLSDVSALDFSASLPAGTLTGTQGTIAGASPDQAFRDRLTQWAAGSAGLALPDFHYAAESYDATILAALAAARGGGVDSDTIRTNLAAVSGASGGQSCPTYAACLALLQKHQEISYAGPSGIGPLDSGNEPTSGQVGVYRYGADNRPVLDHELTGRE